MDKTLTVTYSWWRDAARTSVPKKWVETLEEHAMNRIGEALTGNGCHEGELREELNGMVFRGWYKITEVD